MIKAFYGIEENDVFSYGNLLMDNNKPIFFTQICDVLKNCAHKNQEDVYLYEHTITEFNTLLYQNNCPDKNYCEIKYSKKFIKEETENKTYYDKYQSNISDVFIFSGNSDNSNYPPIPIYIILIIIIITKNK